MTARLARFAELRELSAADRARRLAEISVTEPALAHELERMLAADAETTGPLERMIEGVAASTERRLAELDAERAPPRVGAWSLRERIGAGGMGEVWRGERRDGGFEQTAAIKLVRAGMATEGIVARFLVERQLLARLEHPSIAKVLDGGIAADGRPWFAMELVDGRPITEHASAHRLPIEERVRRIAEVADAVAFAHGALVVHRDLKPSNILVDEQGRVKLLDFGLAKLLDPAVVVDATRTELQALTPAYASPEQLLGEPVTTATDVYALGVVLYEVVTGARPHRRSAKTGAGLVAELDTEVIERPSAVVMRSGADEDLAARALARRLRGDLDTVILKALAREPSRRYASAADFARDLRNWLGGHPVTARPDTLGYRSSRFVRRHALAVAAATLLFAVLVAGLVGTTWQARRAERQAARAERVQEFLIGLFQGSDPDRTRGRTVTARELLVEGARQLEERLAEEPETRADLLDAVAQIERRLGLTDEARSHALAAIALRVGSFGESAVETARARTTLAEIEIDRGDVAGSRSVLTSALAALERTGPEEAAAQERAEEALLSVLMMEGKAEEGLAVAERRFERELRRHGPHAVETAQAGLELGQMLHLSDRFDEAMAQLESSLETLERELGAGDVRTELARLALAEIASYRGDIERGERLFRATIEALLRTRGEGHVLVAQARLKYALLLINDNRAAEADRELEAAFTTFDAVDHFDAASCLRMLGHSLSARGRHAEAAEKFAAARDRFRAKLGPEGLLTWMATANLGGAQVAMGELEAGRDSLLAASAGLARIAGAEADDLRQPLLALGEAERRLGRPGEALAIHRRLLAIAEKTVGERHAGAANAHREIALDLEAIGTAETLAEARREIALAIEIRSELQPKLPRIADWWLDAARIARRAGDEAGARRAVESAVELRRTLFGDDDARTREALAALVERTAPVDDRP